MEKKHLNSTAFERKLSIYSGHDLTIVNLMNTLGFSDLLIPDYSSAFIIELHKQPNATDSEIRVGFFIAFAFIF